MTGGEAQPTQFITNAAKDIPLLRRFNSSGATVTPSLGLNGTDLNDSIALSHFLLDTFNDHTREVRMGAAQVGDMLHIHLDASGLITSEATGGLATGAGLGVGAGTLIAGCIANSALGRTNAISITPFNLSANDATQLASVATQAAEYCTTYYLLLVTTYFCTSYLYFCTPRRQRWLQTQLTTYYLLLTPVLTIYYLGSGGCEHNCRRGRSDRRIT